MQSSFFVLSLLLLSLSLVFPPQHLAEVTRKTGIVDSTYLYRNYLFAKDKNRNNVSDTLELSLSNTKKSFIDILLATTRRTLRRVEAILKKLKASKIEVFPHINMIHTVIRRTKLIQALNILAHKVWIEENIRVFPTANKAVFSLPSLFPYDHINIGYNGSRALTVGIIDTGICVNNPWLADKVVYFNDVTGELRAPGDWIGHGTMIASIIAARRISLEIPQILVHWGKIGLSEQYPISILVRETQKIGFRVDTRNPDGIVLLRIIHENMSAYEVRCDAFPFWYNITLSKGYIKVYIRAENASTDFPYILHILFSKSKAYWGGIAPNVKLAVWKVFREAEFETDVAKILRAIDDLLGVYKQLNLTILNLSISTDKESALLNVAIDQLVQRGILVVAAAGNDYMKYGAEKQNQIKSPGSAKYAITVAALNEMHGIAIYSSRGGIYGEYLEYIKPDISAFGGGLIYGSWIMAVDSDDSDFIFNDAFGNDFFLGVGTSFASAYVSGILALIVSKIFETKGWNWSLEQALHIKAILLGSAFETALIGTHETSFRGIQRPPPPLSHGEKDYDEGFGEIFPLETFRIATQQGITMDTEIEINLNSSYPVFGLVLRSDGLIRISVKMSRVDVADLVIYDLASTDGSPLRYWSTSSSNSKIFLSSGNMLVVIKLYRSGEVHVELTVRILAGRESIVAITIGMATIVWILVAYSLYLIAKRIVRLIKRR